jgi:plasmid maintenance system antidote protein VapI
MALRLAAALHTSPEMWLNMQVAYELYVAEQKPIPKVRSILKKPEPSHAR